MIIEKHNSSDKDTVIGSSKIQIVKSRLSALEAKEQIEADLERSRNAHRATLDRLEKKDEATGKLEMF